MEVYHPSLGNDIRVLPLGFGIPDVGGDDSWSKGGFLITGSALLNPGVLGDFSRAEGVYALGGRGFFPDLSGELGWAASKKGRILEGRSILITRLI